MEDFFCLRAQFVAVRAEYFDHNLPIDLRDAFQHVIPYGLRKGQLHTGQDRYFLRELLDQLFAREPLRPFGGRFQIHEKFGHIDRFWIGPIVRTAGFRRNGPNDFRVAQDIAHHRREPPRFIHRNARRKVNVDPHGSFVQLRQEFGAQTRQRPYAGPQQHDGNQDYDFTVRQSPRKRWPIESLEKANYGILLLGNSFPQEKVTKQRHQGERQQQRTY